MYDVNKLPLDKLVTKDLDDSLENFIEIPAPYFIRDGHLYMDLETDVIVGDYYMGMFICPEIEKWAEANGGFWEWENPGCLMFVI
ncbi:MAG: hypothetical protein R3230_01055 [Nitrosopumilaceae archaeon]|nr:hypothetical protein [Nitrosopumilaceae archaeon]